MSENVLHHIIVGRATNADQSSDSLSVLALSDDFTDEILTTIQNAVPLAPLPVNGQLASQSIALVPRDGSYRVADDNRVYILARCHYQDGKQSAPAYEYVILKGTILDSFGGDIEPLFTLFEQTIPQYAVTHAPLESLPLPLGETGALDNDASIVNTVLHEIAHGDKNKLLAILSAALEGGVIICGFPADTQQRLKLVQGLTMLLPKPVRGYMTFSTRATDLNRRLPRIVFSDADGANEVRRIDWKSTEVDEALLKQPYIAHLQRLWGDDDLTLAGTLQALSALAHNIMSGHVLVDGLQILVERHQHDMNVIRREPVAADIMIGILDSDNPPDRELKLLYLEHLLRIAFDDRNPDAAQRVAQEMDNDEGFDERLQTLFKEALETQPDAAYFLARTRLADGVDERWLQRIHQAAEKSLDVAIESGSVDVLSSWLNLISREPSRYELADILRSGILAARKRAPEHATLTQDLLVMSVKRQPETLSTLLHDPQIMSVLPEHILNAVERFEGSAIESLASESRELFLLAVKEVIDADEPHITSTIIRSVWEIQQQSLVVASEFRPLHLIKRMAQAKNIFVDNALDTMLTLLLASGNDTLFFEIAPALAENYDLPQLAAIALQKSGRKLSDVMDVISRLTGNDILDAQETITTYTTLLGRYNTPEATVALVEQLARVLVQYPETTASINTMWRIAEHSGDVKNESMVRVSTRRLMNDIEQLIDEKQIIANVQRLRKAISWSNTGRSSIMRWWRQYTRSLGLVQLQKLSKALEGQRNMEDLRPIVQTNIALKRIFGQRNLEEVSQDIHTAFNVLQAFSESFDSDSKSSIDIDSTTIRTEMEARDDELSAEMRQIFATNLKELAQLITTLSENRSRPTILRNEESLERQLYIGEAQPQSAIDVMRWLSGYFVGVQKDETEE